MRTTVDLDGDVLVIVKAAAAARGVSLGGAVSAMLRESLARPVEVRLKDGFPVMPPVPGGKSEPLTAEAVAAALEEDDLAAARMLMKPGR